MLWCYGITRAGAQNRMASTGTDRRPLNPAFSRAISFGPELLPELQGPFR